MPHTTTKEIEFITGLITGKFLNRPPALDKDDLLRNYINTAIIRKQHNTEPRVNWDECIAYAGNLIG